MAVDWTFNGTWPYEPRWFDSADGRMHYVDEADVRAAYLAPQPELVQPNRNLGVSS